MLCIGSYTPQSHHITTESAGCPYIRCHPGFCNRLWKPFVVITLLVIHLTTKQCPTPRHVNFHATAISFLSSKRLVHTFFKGSSVLGRFLDLLGAYVINWSYATQSCKTSTMTCWFIFLAIGLPSCDLQNLAAGGSSAWFSVHIYYRWTYMLRSSRKHQHRRLECSSWRSCEKSFWK